MHRAILENILEALIVFLFGRWIALYSAEERRKVMETALEVMDEYQADLDYLKEA